MAKDPAVLFYTSDFITGTLTMNDEQRGKYIILLCLQHQQGLLCDDDMKNICKTYDAKIYAKFIKTEDGFYYNERMKIETDKRKKYSESRSNNRKQISKSYDKHMENEDVNEDIVKIDYEFIINLYHNLCPKMAKVVKLTDKRKGFVNARIAEFGIDKITEALRKSGQSDFLNGQNDRAWKADFEWIMRPENFVKILECKYDNKITSLKVAM